MQFQLNAVKCGALSILMSSLFVASSPAQAASLKEAFAQGKYNAQLRAYNNTLVVQHGGDKYGTAFGGRVGYETKAEELWGFSTGFAYYTANDLGTTHSDPAARAPFTPTVDVDILGEAYGRYSRYDTVITAGRQLILSPHANPSDAFLVPVTFTGYSLVNKSVEGLTVNAAQLLSIKNRESQTFVNVGQYITNRFGKPVKYTDGTLMFGLTYEIEKLKVQAWHYGFADMFNMEWLEADYRFDLLGHTPYVSAHYGSESDTGGQLLGTLDSRLTGAKAGVKFYGADISLGYDNVSKDKFYSPYTFFTDATYTNSMITGISNISSGNAWKLMATYDFNPQLWSKLSYSKFKFNDGTDIAEADFDLRYKFTGDFAGLSLWFRAGYRDGDKTPATLPDLLEYRTQLQYVF